MSWPGGRGGTPVLAGEESVGRVPGLGYPPPPLPGGQTENITILRMGAVKMLNIFYNVPSLSEDKSLSAIRFFADDSLFIENTPLRFPWSVRVLLRVT